MATGTLRVALVLAALPSTVAPAPVRAAAPASGPSFDCARARAADEKIICATPDLSDLDRRMGEAYAAALAGATPAERERLRAEHEPWLRLRLGCAGSGSAAPDERSAAATCMRPLYARRIAELVGHAPPPPEGVRSRSIRWSDEKRHAEVDIAYPALAPGTPGAAAFDDFFERQARRWEARARALAAEPRARELAGLGGMPTTVEVSFEVPLGNRRIVTVVSRGYEVPTGAAHPLPFRTATTFDLARGRALGEADLFAPGGMKRAAAFAVERLRAISGNLDEAALRAARKAAGELSNWAFGAGAVEVTFPAYTLGPYARAETRVPIGYGELRPLLAKGAPLPGR